MGLRVWIWLLSLSVLWGGSFFFAKVAIGELGPLTVVFARVALAALALNIVLAATGNGLFRRGTPWRDYVIMGLLNNALPFSLIFWGQTQIASGLASILNATTPLFTLVVAHFLTADEKIDPAKVAALLAGFAGVALLIGPELLVGGASVSGELACLGAAISYAFAGVYGRRFKTMKIAPIEAAAGQVTASTVLFCRSCWPSSSPGRCQRCLRPPSGQRSAAWQCSRRPSPTCFISAFWPPPAPPTCCSLPS